MEADVIVVGAGVVGSAVAYAFANQGRKVILIERSFAEPDRIVGELLQPGGVCALQEIGLGDCVQDIDAIPVRGYAILRDAQLITLGYPDCPRFAATDSTLGYSFHHGRFVQRLRHRCLNTLGITPVEGAVSELIEDSGQKIVGVRARRKVSGATIEEMYRAKITIICDGCFSSTRTRFNLGYPRCDSNFVGLVLQNCTLPIAEHGHVILGHPSPILLYQIGRKETRILIDIPHKIVTALDGDEELRFYLTSQVTPRLPESIQDSFLKALALGRVRTMPNSYLPPRRYKYRGAVLLGDSFNMRHPLTGGGMTVGLQDALLLAQLLSRDKLPDLADDTQVEQAFDKFFTLRKRHAAVINILSVALYRIFSTTNGDSATLRDGCFDYFQRGGRYQKDPMGLLAGLYQKPTLLTGHFFNVAFYSIYRRFRQAHWYQFPIVWLDSIRDLVRATSILLPLLWRELSY